MPEQRSSTKGLTELRIVEAAAQMFARHGFKAATIREIAHLAELNEVTLFRYFLHKPDLFWAAVESRLSRVKLGQELQMSLAADEPPALVVPKIVRFFLQSLAQDPELYRLLHVAAFELPGADKVIHEHLGPILNAVNAYFERCAHKGLAHRVAGWLAALGILGTVMAHYTLYPLIAGAEPSFPGFDEEVAACSEVWLRALVGNSPAENTPSVAVKDSGISSL